MSTDTRAPQTAESYATFWEPIPLDAAQVPVPVPNDAYQDFVNVTENPPVALQVEQIDI